MLRLPTFDYYRPTSLAEAARLIAGQSPDQVRLVAGGTDLWPNLKRRHQKAEAVVSLAGVPDLRGVTCRPDGSLKIGALTPLSELAAHPELGARLPALVVALGSISSPVLRNQGTLGGNLCLDTRCTYYNQSEEWRRAISYCMKAEGEVCWVAPGSPRCWAVSSSDAAPMLSALGARVRLVCHEGERWLPLPELYQDDGMAYLTKRPDEILTEIELPADAASARSAFWKLRRRGSIDFAVLSVAASLWLDDAGRVERARVYLGAVASFPAPAKATMEALEGRKLDEETVRTAAELARRDATPMDNTDFQPAWRGAMVARYVEAALRDCAGLPRQRLEPRLGQA